MFATLDEDLRPSQQYRTLFMRQLILGGVLGPSFVVEYGPDGRRHRSHDRRRRCLRYLLQGTRRRRSDALAGWPAHKARVPDIRHDWPIAA